MNKKLFLLIALLSVFSAAFSQSKQLTLEDAIWNRWFDLAPEDLDQVQWRGQSDQYVYIQDWTKIVGAKYNSADAKEICSVSDVVKELKAAGVEPIRYFNQLVWIDENTFYQEYGSLVYVYNVSTKKLVSSFSLPEDAANVAYNAKANAVAFTVDNNIKMMDEKGNIVDISNESNKGIVYGDSYVHRQEFGIDKGIFWSPEGSYIAFYRKDETMVADYPLVDYTTFPATLKNIKYPMTGQTSEEVTLGVYDIAKKSITYMKTGTPKEQYLTAITWDPNEKFVYIGILNRDQNHLKFNKYSSVNGDFVKTLFEEKNPKYVEPEHPAYFLNNTKNQFVWYSERDGYNHLYLYDTDGNLIKQLTKGVWVVTDFYGFSADEKYLYIQSTAECALQRHIYSISVKDGKMDMLTQEHGTHYGTFSANKKYFIDQFSSTETPNVIQVKNIKGKKLNVLVNAENPVADYKLGKQKIGIIKAADNKTDLYYQMVLPPDFDSTKKYPVIIYVYGGPHLQLITDSWTSASWDLYMAQKGYIMFSLDNRGSSDRGFEFESVVHRQLGVEEMKDQMKGVEFLKSKSYVDADRIGVHGWSFGGFMTTSLMTDHADVFKVGVAGGPVIDWKYYEVMYGERYMDTPQSNPEGFEKTSVLNKINKLKGKLLVIHGGIDPVVVPQNSMDLLLKSQELGIQVDFYTYPNSEHNVRGKGRIHLMEKVTNYFDEYL